MIAFLFFLVLTLSRGGRRAFRRDDPLVLMGAAPLVAPGLPFPVSKRSIPRIYPPSQTARQPKPLQKVGKVTRHQPQTTIYTCSLSMKMRGSIARNVCLPSLGGCRGGGLCWRPVERWAQPVQSAPQSSPAQGHHLPRKLARPAWRWVLAKTSPSHQGQGLDPTDP